MENNPLLLVRALSKMVERRLLSPAQFEGEIDRLTTMPEFPFAAVNITIGRSEISVGTIGEGPPSTTQVIALGSSDRHQHAQLSVWPKRGEAFESVDLLAAVPLLESAFASWWMKDRRSAKGDLITYSPEVMSRCEAAFHLALADNSEFCVLFVDLDNFGEVNKAKGHSAGDEAIRLMSGFLEARVTAFGVLIHFGGDEFVAVLAGVRTDHAIAMAVEMLADARTFDFGTDPVPVGLSIGMATTSCSAATSFTDLLNEANFALNNLVKKDGSTKGSVRIAGAQSPIQSNSIPYEVLAVTLRSGLGPESNIRVFENEWLNGLHALARQRVTAGITVGEIAAQLRIWFSLLKIESGAGIGSTVPFVGLSSLELSISEIDLISVVARLILEESCRTGVAMGILEVNFTETTASLYYDSIVQITVPNLSSIRSGSFSLGVPQTILVRTDDAHAAGLCFEPSQFMLVEVGHSVVRILSRLAAEHVVIDDRPVRGGGLPDFWELAISKIITRLAELPNVRRIVILNPKGEHYETTKRLLAPKEWNFDHYQYKCAVPKQLISAAVDRIQDSVSIHADEIDALRSLIELYKEPFALAFGGVGGAAPGIMLQRTIQDPHIALDIEDGCRVETAERAYPIVLELIRKSSNDDTSITDQEGEELRELTDFKIVLSTPETGKIPRFFSSPNEAARLEEYFQQQFLSKDGRFGSAFNQDDAWERVLAHVMWSVTKGSRKPFSTRRAIIVLPHVPDPEPEEVAPLGLVSVRFLPQPRSNEIVLNTSFTWRTVEALIGLPYSLYGSIRVSETARDRLAELTGCRVRLGFVSYVANSLHFFMSNQCQLIARQIVNESSD